ncbi:uncharacterized protein J4E87_007914 [Alternaria ethzedia]|uniref:uncharacterized protein n=1 Tax=Alternaria ethzedia TaxID=181014 RepID=UPI0020C3B7C4|nr:uncharacterized protein J4E87_007914 [Alternaria ethzedia]KAI4618246.1 hypothetical protein J4E87_007914 [Alternaria ethzedia]
MDIDDTKTPTPDGTESPIFEPEVPTELLIPDLPALATTDATEIIDLSSLTNESTGEEQHASPYIQKLKVLEADAKQEISSWDPKYLSQDPDVTTAAAAAGTKRKAAAMEDELDSDLDDDDSDDGDDRVPAYDPDQQNRPKLPLYHPGFNLTESTATNILSTIGQYITKSIRSGYDDAEAKHLREQILRNNKIPYQETVRISVAGDTGAGKSALLNALLGVVNLNVESDGGSACTCVITEFQQAPPSQTKAYAAEVEFFDVTICIKMVTDLFTQWYNAKQKQRQDADDLDDKDLDQIKTARDCLQLLFADRLEYGTMEKFLSTATSAKDQKVIKQLTTWTTKMHQDFVKPGQTSVCFESSTPENLIEMYQPFTKEVTNASFQGKPLTCSPWPFVRINRVFLKSPILQQNVIISDIPGGSDVNYFRRDTADRYLQSCHMTIVVAKIDRITNDLSFRQKYVDAFRRRRSGSVILVGTKSDIMNTEINSTLKMDVAAEDQLASITNKVTEIEKDIQNIDNTIRHNMIDRNTTANKPLKKRKKKLTSRKNDLAKQRKDILIVARNKEVTVAMSENYREDTGDDAIAAIYCVSNLMYMRHLRGYDKTDPLSIPTMTLDQTQIPALCSHVYTLSSRGRTSDLDHFVRVTVPTLLNIVQMSVSTTTLARVNHLTGIIQRARKDIDASIKRLALKFHNTDIKLLHDQLADPALQTRFDKEALKKLVEWEDMNAASHRAACRKKGIYVQKKKCIAMDWNEDFMWPVRPYIDVAFRVIIDDSCELFKAEATQDIKEIITALDTKLKSKTMKLARHQYLREAIPGPMGPFAQIASYAKVDAEKSIKRAGDELKKNLNEMLRNVQTDFERMKNRKDNDTEQGKAFRKQLHELVEEARRILNGVTQESLDLCKQYK